MRYFGPSQGENNTNMKSPADDPVNGEVMVFLYDWTRTIKMLVGSG